MKNMTSKDRGSFSPRSGCLDDIQHPVSKKKSDRMNHQMRSEQSHQRLKIVITPVSSVCWEENWNNPLQNSPGSAGS